MQKVKQAKIINYPDTYLFLDDIEKIVTIFKDNFDEVTIIIDEYQLPDLSKVAEIKKDFVTTMNIAGRSDYTKANHTEGQASLEMREYQLQIYYSDRDNTNLIGVTKKIEDILIKRKQKSKVFYRSFWPYLLLNLLAIATLSILDILRIISAIGYFVLLLTLVIFIAVIASIVNSYGYKTRYRLFLYESRTRKNIFARNKDQIFLSLFGILCVIVGSVITLIIQHILFPK